MLLTNRLLLLFFFHAFWMKIIVQEVQAITVGSSVTTDDNSSWISSSGNFAFGFYGESNVFFVGIRLFASPTETVVVWTARPDLKRFSKHAFLNFTDEGLFVTPEKEAVAIALFKFSKATSANMLDNGNFVVFGSANSKISGKSEVVFGSKPRAPYERSCGASYYGCRSASGETYNAVFYARTKARRD